MFTERPKQLAYWVVWLAAALASIATTRAQEHFEVLRVGVVTYSNVMVLNKTPADLFITHARGLSSIKVRDLDAETAEQLGYETEGRPRQRMALPKIEVTPEMQKLQEQLQGQLDTEVKTKLTTLPPLFMMAYVVGMLGIYLFGCYCCKLICDKANAPSRFLVWLPGFQIFPLYRAARMPPWLALGIFAPHAWLAGTFFLMPTLFQANQPPDIHDPRIMAILGVGLVSLLVPFILHVAWCFRIARAREKSGIVGLALLFPPTSFLTFLYLAFSEGASTSEASAAPVPRPDYVTFG